MARRLTRLTPLAIRDFRTIVHFIQACLHHVYKGEHNGTTHKKKGWKVVISQFNSLKKEWKKNMQAQLKNRWDSLKKEWLVWHKFFWLRVR